MQTQETLRRDFLNPLTESTDSDIARNERPTRAVSPIWPGASGAGTKGIELEKTNKASGSLRAPHLVRFSAHPGHCDYDRRDMRTPLLIIAVTLAAVSVTLGESAHKGWHTYSDAPSGRSKTAAVKVYMTGSIVDIRKPDPEANCQFKGGLWANVKDKVSVQKIYLLSPKKSGVLDSREITFDLVRTNVTGVVKGKYGIEFRTAKTAFRKGDVFAVILTVNDSRTVVFQRIVFEKFVPH